MVRALLPGAGRVIMQTMRALQNAAREARMAPMAPLRLRMNAMRSSFSPPRGSVAQATPRAPLGTRGGVRKKWFHQSRRSVGVRIQWVEQALPTTTAGSSAPTVAQPAHQAGSLGMVTPPSMPYEQWRAGYDNACEEARRSWDTLDLHTTCLSQTYTYFTTTTTVRARAPWLVWLWRVKSRRDVLWLLSETSIVFFFFNFKTSLLSSCGIFL